MRGIIEQLKEQREKAEERFIINSLIRRNCKIDEPCPDTDADLDSVAELNEAISTLENAILIKEQEPEKPDEPFITFKTKER